MSQSNDAVNVGESQTKTQVFDKKKSYIFQNHHHHYQHHHHHLAAVLSMYWANASILFSLSRQPVLRNSLLPLLSGFLLDSFLSYGLQVVIRKVNYYVVLDSADTTIIVF